MRLLSFILFIPFLANAYIPSRNANEFRLVMDIHTMSIEGQMLSKKLLSPNIQIGGVFKLGEDESKMGASVSYAMNRVTYLTFAGDINQSKNLGGAVWVHTHHKFSEIGIEVLPFISIDKKLLGSVGVVVYEEIHGIVIHAGIKVRYFKGKDVGVQLILGTVFIGDIIPKVLGGL